MKRLVALFVLGFSVMAFAAETMAPAGDKPEKTEKTKTKKTEKKTDKGDTEKKTETKTETK